MNLTETAALLTLAASYDRRSVGEHDVRAWHEVLDDVNAADARAAVVAHYRETSEWLMPAHVRQRVAAVRRERLARTPDPTPTADPDDTVAYFDQLRAGRRAIAAVPAASETRSIEGGAR